MTSFQKGFLALIQGALTETPPALPEGFDFGHAYAVAEQHQVLTLIYYGAMFDPSFMGHPMANKYFERSCSYISHSAHQQETVEIICGLFDEAGVDYMPLKGTILKKLYPSPEMRIMGDADILIRMEDYDRVTTVMRSLDGIPLPESDHEYTWALPSKMAIELHKRLIPSYNEDYYAYYGDGWRLAKPIAPGAHRHVMTNEDQLIYLFTHFAKHYRDKGAGVKYVVDFYVFHRCYPDLDMAYLERELKKLQLWEFFRNVMQLISVWFEGAESSEMTDFLTDKIFDDGVFGKEERSAVSSAVRLSKSTKAVKATRAFRLLFPPYDVMCNRNPILRTWPILLPILWIWRLMTTVFSHRERIRIKKKQIALMSDENIDAYRRELNYVGLDFHFGEDALPEGDTDQDGEA